MAVSESKATVPLALTADPSLLQVGQSGPGSVPMMAGRHTKEKRFARSNRFVLEYSHLQLPFPSG